MSPVVIVAVATFIGIIFLWITRCIWIYYTYVLYEYIFSVHLPQDVKMVLKYSCCLKFVGGIIA